MNVNLAAECNLYELSVVLWEIKTTLAGTTLTTKTLC